MQSPWNEDVGPGVLGGDAPEERPLIILAGRLWARFWPQLLFIALAGVLLRELLLELSIRVGFLNHLAGLVTLTLVVLVKLIVVVAMFEIVRPGLPALHAARNQARESLPQDDGGQGDQGHDVRGQVHRGSARLAAVLTAALVPFFAYYAAWGFLGDTIRDYSRLALTLDPFGTHGMPLDILGGWWLILSVALSFLVRRAAKAMRERSGAAILDLVVVMCEANWAFIGLYVLSRWKDDAMSWLGKSGILDHARSLLEWLIHPIGAAHAVIFVPIEHTPSTFLESAQQVFFYALFPLVWLTIAALIYGYDVHRAEAPQERAHRLARAMAWYQSLPSFLRDFLAHFTAGFLKRYRAVANGVRLTVTSSLLPVLTLIVSYRVLDWLSAWAWLGMTRLIGAHELDAWQVIAQALSLLLGSPSAPGEGVLVEPLKICLLAATLERAFSLGRPWLSPVPAKAG